MISRLNPTHLFFVGLVLTSAAGVRDPWSRPVSSRADVKLAPCMARPNLFSGD
jgi:hypothetical protein